MARFNTSAHINRRGRGLTTTTPEGRNHEGSVGQRMDTKSELFITATTSFLEDSFYEQASDTRDRIMALSASVAVADPEWMGKFVHWLRRGGNMRSSAALVAVSAASIMTSANIPGARGIIASAIDRADEPGEIVAAWRALVGRRLPNAVQKGIGDAINRVWTEYSVLKYNSASAAYSMRDVMNLTHPKMENQALGRYIFGTAYGDEDISLDGLPMIAARQRFSEASDSEKRRMVLSGEAQRAGITWEVAASLGKPDAAMWEALLPSMGYMARLRSLRRLEEAGVSDKVLDDLAQWLADPANVAKSRQLPLRFLSAFRQVPSMRFQWPLEQAVNHSLANIDILPGSTLVMVDRSGSMHALLSARSSLTREDAANVFGTAVARRCERATFVDFATESAEVDFRKYRSVLEMANRPSDIGWATNTTTAVRRHFDGHDRVIILTDDQSRDGDPGSVVPRDVPMYVWELSGYHTGAFSTGENRYAFSGLTDSSFRTIPMVEAGKDQRWPWEH